jgi:hypothetical protein
VTIPPGVTDIGDCAFFGNKITSITIPASVTSIEERAFGKNKIKSITIGANVKLGVEDRSTIYDRSAFDHGFDDFYEKNGRKKGTYVYINENWSAR